MNNNALLPYYGCKRQASKQILPLIGKPKAFWDICCGSCAVSLAIPECKITVINDLNLNVINLAKVIADDTMSVVLFEKLYRTLYSQELYEECSYRLQLWELNAEPTNYSEIELAYYYFVVSWMGRNGLTGTTNEYKLGFSKRFTSDGGDSARRFKYSVDNIPEWYDKMRNWTILSMDCCELARKIEDKQGTVIYVDPPYLVKQAKYKFDFNNINQHEALANVLQRFKETRVVVSYYEHPLLKELYKDGWHFQSIDVNKNLTESSTKAPEILITNWKP